MRNDSIIYIGFDTHTEHAEVAYTGDKVKKDKRDAQQLARLRKSGDLDPVYVPEPEDEAVGGLSLGSE